MLSEVTRYSFYLNEIKEMPFSNICSLSFFFLALSTTTTSPSSHCQASTTCPSYGHCEYWEASCPLHGIATNAAQSGIYILYLHLVINLNSFFEDLLLDWSPFPGSVVTPYQLSRAVVCLCSRHCLGWTCWDGCLTQMPVLHCRTQTTIDINNYTVPKSCMNHSLLSLRY